MRALLLSPRCKVVVVNLPEDYADITWDDDAVVVRISAEQEEQVRLFIHEALHYVLREELHDVFDPVIEEMVILALEQMFYDNDIRQKGRSIAWWRRALARKLAQQA